MKYLIILPLIFCVGCSHSNRETEIPIKDAPPGMRAYLKGNTIHIVQEGSPLLNDIARRLAEDTAKKPPEPPMTAEQAAFIIDSPHCTAIGSEVAEAIAFRNNHQIKSTTTRNTDTTKQDKP